MRKVTSRTIVSLARQSPNGKSGGETCCKCYVKLRTHCAHSVPIEFRETHVRPPCPRRGKGKEGVLGLRAENVYSGQKNVTSYERLVAAGQVESPKPSS